MRLTYDAVCFACCAEWRGLEVDDSALGPGEVNEISTCPDCFKVAAVTVKLTSEEVASYRRKVLKTVQKMYQGYLKGQRRLEEKRKVLAGEARGGRGDALDTLSLLDARIAALRPPDTVHLDARARELAEVEADAPAEAEVVPCADCGSATAVHREGYHGFEVPCPRCATKLMIKARPES